MWSAGGTHGCCNATSSQACSLTALEVSVQNQSHWAETMLSARLCPPHPGRCGFHVLAVPGGGRPAPSQPEPQPSRPSAVSHVPLSPSHKDPGAAFRAHLNHSGSPPTSGSVTSSRLQSPFSHGWGQPQVPGMRTWTYLEDINRPTTVINCVCFVFPLSLRMHAFLSIQCVTVSCSRLALILG